MFIIMIIVFVIIIVVIIAIITTWCYAPSVFTCIVGGAIEMTVLLFTIHVDRYIANYPDRTISSTDWYDPVTSLYDQLATVLEMLPLSVNWLVTG